MAVWRYGIRPLHHYTITPLHRYTVAPLYHYTFINIFAAILIQPTMETSFFDSGFFSYLILPFLIFAARICDVSIGTMRIIFVSKGKRNIAPFLGFFEVLIWIIAISKIMQNLDNYSNYFAYAAGFATGNYVGMIIEEKLAVGIQMIRVFVNNNMTDLVHNLNISGYGATVVEARGARENVHLIYIIVQRNDLANVIEVINKFNPKSFYTIEDVRSVSEGIFPPKKPHSIFTSSHMMRRWRRGK
jgi:uncharacterized protein YebE (UPF0316 family)